MSENRRVKDCYCMDVALWWTCTLYFAKSVLIAIDYLCSLSPTSSFRFQDRLLTMTTFFETSVYGKYKWRVASWFPVSHLKALRTSMYCIVLFCIVLHSIVLCSIVLCCVVLHYMLYCVVLLLCCMYCIVIVLYFIMLYCIVVVLFVLCCIVLCCIVLNCIELCCVYIVLYYIYLRVLCCTVLYYVVLCLYCVAFGIVLYCIVQSTSRRTCMESAT